MQISIKATNINLTPEISDYLQKKIDMLDRMIDPTDTSIHCSVEIGKISNHHKGGDVFRTEINLKKEGKYFRAVSEEESVNASIDEAKDEMLREIKSYKSKQETLLRRGGAAVKNIIKGVGSGTGYVIGGIGSGIGYGFGSIKRFKFRRPRRRD